MNWKPFGLCMIALGVLGFAKSATAAITTYTTRAAWNAAIGGSPTFLVDFNNFAVDGDFRASPFDAGPFSLDEQGPSQPLGNNLVDAPPFAPISSNLNFDGTTYASILIVPGPTPTTVLLTFDSPLVAWGGDFVHPGNGTLLTLEITSAAGVLTTQVPGTGLTTGFFGFTVASNEQFTSIRFRNSTTDGFGLDNVAGELATEPIPEPATLSLWSLGFLGSVVAGYRRRLAA